MPQLDQTPPKPGMQSFVGRFLMGFALIEHLGGDGVRAFMFRKMEELVHTAGGREPEGFIMLQDKTPDHICKCCSGLVHVAFICRVWAYRREGGVLKAEPVPLTGLN